MKVWHFKYYLLRMMDESNTISTRKNEGSITEFLWSHTQHIFKNLIQLITDFLDLHFLSKEIFFNLVNSDIQSLDVHLGLLSSVLTCFQFHSQIQNFCLILLFSFDGFLLTNFQHLKILTHNSQLFFNIYYFLLSNFCSFIAPDRIRLQCSQFSGDIIVLCFWCNKIQLWFPKLFIQSINMLFIWRNSIFQLSSLFYSIISSKYKTS